MRMVLLCGLLVAGTWFGVACDPTPVKEGGDQEQVQPDSLADGGVVDRGANEPAPDANEPPTGNEPSVSEPPTGKEPMSEPPVEPAPVDAGMELVPEMMVEKAPEMKPDMPTTSSVPVDATKLFAWLQAAKYGKWSAESSIHPSIRIHAANARVFINSTIEASLKAGNKVHPVGSALVKELFEQDKLTLKGWAVMVKTTTANGDGSDWYWYEVLSTTNGSNPVANGNGVSLCTGCHSSGPDFVRTKYPLQ